MRYTVRHVTCFTYDTPVTESVMEARMQPRTDAFQRCLRFALTTAPAARVMMYQDHDENAVHHFDIPGRHARLTVSADALVDCLPPEPLPDRLGADAWGALAALRLSGQWFEFLTPSAFARPTPLLESFATELSLPRRDGEGGPRAERGDPLVLLRRVMDEVYTRLEYRPQTTRVDSPIDEALMERGGVCQDFAHLCIALMRRAGIPSRYVSGYLHRDLDSHDRSAADATHAWVECFLPELGWVGFDPTNNVMAGERHIRVAVGRDYADVPPTRGVYKGMTAVRTELAVAVRVGPARAALAGAVLPFTPWTSRDATVPPEVPDAEQQQQQQQ
jgi:transglutaminase-like putative cysteine protease